MRKRHHTVLIVRRGITLPEEGVSVFLNPMERTLYKLFLEHPEGLPADSLPAYWEELSAIYLSESRFDDQPLRDSALESLCAESKRVFYSNVSRIKKKITSALGRQKGAAYIIKRGKDGLYRAKATLG